jgi:hypothetical protein
LLWWSIVFRSPVSPSFWSSSWQKW